MRVDKKAMPRTQPKPLREPTDPRYTATDIEDSSYIDLCIRPHPRRRLWKSTGVYIRPDGIAIPELQEMKELESYRFDKIDVLGLRDAVIKALHPLEPIESHERPDNVFLYIYPYSHKRRIYSSIKNLINQF